MNVQSTLNIAKDYFQIKFENGECLILNVKDGDSIEKVKAEFVEASARLEKLSVKQAKTLTGPVWIGTALYGTCNSKIVKTSRVLSITQTDDSAKVETLNSLYTLVFEDNANKEHFFDCAVAPINYKG